ncbi:MAG: filamentous hemagglutinin N-terminal domain-containing protein, partial [Rubrivivax sp.]
MAACSMLSFWPGGPQAQGLPSGMNTVAGQVSSKTNGNALTVTNSPNAIINWKSFSIGAQNSVRFDQVNSGSKVLNRVTGNDPSSILGSLSSNGHVWLLNQNGVLFGQGARVNVAGLVASTLNMSDTNWLLGRHQFSL